MKTLFELKQNGKKYKRSINVTTNGDTNLGLECFPLEINIQLINIPFVYESVFTKEGKGGDVTILKSHASNDVSFQVKFNDIFDLLIVTEWLNESHDISINRRVIEDIDVKKNCNSYVKSVKLGDTPRRHSSKYFTIKAYDDIDKSFINIVHSLVSKVFNKQIPSEFLRLVKYILKDKENIANLKDTPDYLVKVNSLLRIEADVNSGISYR